MDPSSFRNSSNNIDAAPNNNFDFSDFEKDNFIGEDNDQKEIDEVNNNLKNLNLSENNNQFTFERKILKPRDYQQKIFEKAKNQNSIIYVETGRGKTFISIMLMADFLGIDISQNSNIGVKKKSDKKIIFFVCDTALIEQQKSAISSILGLEVATIQGRKNKKYKNDYESFRKLWKSVNIFVAIPSIIYKLLSSGYLNIFEISMMIFDECHHTDADHPYNKIMSEFYFFYKIKKPNLNYPRIYGLTASPLKKGIKSTIEVTALQALQTLCENLDCCIIIDPDMKNSHASGLKLGETIEQYLKSDNYVEVKPHTQIPEYKKLAVLICNICYEKFLTIALADIMKNREEFNNREGDIRGEYKKMMLKRLGALNLEEYNKITETYIHLYNYRKLSPFFLIFEKLQRQIFMILENLCLNSLISFFSDLVAIYTDLFFKKQKEEEDKEKYKSKIDLGNSFNLLSLSKSSVQSEDDDDDLELEKDTASLTSRSIQEILNVYTQTCDSLESLQNEYNYSSDRLDRLYKKIDELFMKDPNSIFIIFIANRIVAHFLSPSLKIYLNKNHKSKKCQEIIGISKRKSDNGTSLTPSMTLSQLNETITNFNTGKFSILIGTSAIEEGIDIQTCNAVISLVNLRTPKSFIQIKGRARKSNSEFIVFTNSVEAEKKKIEKFILVGEKFNEYFKNDIIQDFRRKDFITFKPKINGFFIPESHAKITLGNAREFMNEIKQQISAAGFKFEMSIETRELKSNIKTTPYEYISYLTIDSTLPKLLNWKYETGRKTSKEGAEKLCYYKTILQLKDLGYLDIHLKFQKENK